MEAASQDAPRPYAGLKVLEYALDTGGEMLGRMLGEMGADVIKAEPPQGSPTRSVGPFDGDKRDGDSSLNFWFYNTGKRSVTVELGDDSAAALASWLEDADIFIITLQPKALAAAGIDLKAIEAAYPGLIIVSMTPFGLSGPYADWHACNLTALALGGPLNMCGYDDHSIPPVNPGGEQAFHTAAAFAHIGLLGALLHRQQTGEGQLVEVSMHGANAVNQELGNPYWLYNRVNVQRQTCRHAQPVMTQSAMFECADGQWVYYTLILSDTRSWNILVEWMNDFGIAEIISGPEFQDVEHRQAEFAQIQELVECFFLLMEGRTAYLEGQKRGLPIGIMYAPEDLPEDEHLQERAFFVPVEQADGKTVIFPGSPYKFSNFIGEPTRRAPSLGEHADAKFRQFD